MYISLFECKGTALEFSEDQEMFMAFDVLTEYFLEEFRKLPASKLVDVIRWCEQYCDLCAINASFRASTMDDLFQLLRKLPHHNFLNPGLLKYLAELSKCKYLVQSVKNYEKVFSSVKLNNLIESMGDKIQEIQVLKKNEIIMNCDEMIMKLEKEDMTVSELHGFTVKFQQNILYLRVGINLPRCVKKGCICIQWLIPSCLVDYVYHMACLNTKLFAEFNLLHVSVGKYKVELAEHSIGSKCYVPCMYSMLYLHYVLLMCKFKGVKCTILCRFIFLSVAIKCTFLAPVPLLHKQILDLKLCDKLVLN